MCIAYRYILRICFFYFQEFSHAKMVIMSISQSLNGIMFQHLHLRIRPVYNISLFHGPSILHNIWKATKELLDALACPSPVRLPAVQPASPGHAYLVRPSPVIRDGGMGMWTHRSMDTSSKGRTFQGKGARSRGLLGWGRINIELSK